MCYGFADSAKRASIYMLMIIVKCEITLCADIYLKLEEKIEEKTNGIRHIMLD